MKRIVWTFGGIGGLIVSIMMLITFSAGIVTWDNGETIGFTTMIIALSVIFFGVRSYRDNFLSGHIRFGRAFVIGLYIALIASTMYVIAWLIISNTIAVDFMDQYYIHTAEQLQNSGLPQEDIQQQLDGMKDFQEMYKNPLVKIAFTYLEILPVGILMSLISALILKRNVKN